MDKTFAVGDRVRVIGMEQKILESRWMRNPIGMSGVVTSIDCDYNTAPIEVEFPEDEPDGATDSYSRGDWYPELYKASELEKIEED